MNFQLDINKVVQDMVQASANSLIKGGKQAKEYATHEYTQFISDIEHVQTMAEQKLVTKDVAQYLVEQHKLSMRAVLLTIEGLGEISVQNAINAGMKVLNDALIASLGTAFQALKFTL